jgi:hypothetical protein
MMHALLVVGCLLVAFIILMALITGLGRGRV